MASWWEDYKKRKGLSSGGSDSQAGKTYNERMTTDEHRQAAKSSTWWEDYKKKNDLERRAADDRQRAAYMEKKRARDQQSYMQYTAAQRQLEENRSRDAAEDEIRELFRNPFSSDAEWQARALERAASRYGRDFPLYQEMLKSSAYSPALYNRSYSQAAGAYNDLIAKRDSYTTTMKKAEEERNESNLVNRPAQWQAENLTPQEIEQRLAYYRSEAATPTVTDRDREEHSYLYPEAALQKVPHGARFDERLLEGAGQDAIDALNRPILTEQEKAAVEEADRKIIEEKASRNYEQVQRLLAAQAGQTEAFSRARGDELIEEIAKGGEAAKQVEDGRAAFEAKQQQIASETSFEIGDDLDSNRGAYNKMQKERRERGYILGYDWDNVPEARKQAVYALYAQDPEKAMELAKYYIADARQAEDEERQAWYAQSGWTAALGLVSSAAAHLGAAVDPFGDVGQELTRRGDNALAGGSQWADAATDYKKIPEWVPIVGGKGAGDFYQTVGSVVQSAAVAAPAILVGRYDKAAAEIVGKLGLVLMGSSAAASDYRESVAAGMDEDRAKLHALAAGVEEALFEEVSLDKLIKMDTSGGLKSALKNWLVQSGIEGSEELATSIANRITDEMISGAGQSKVERRASELIANGMNSTEAHTQAESEWMTDTLYEGFSGFLSGGMMTGGNYALKGLANLKERAVNAAETRKAQKQAGAAVSRSEGSVEALQAYAKDNGIEIKSVETAEQSAEQGGQKADQNSYSASDYRSISDTNSKVVQSIRNEVRGKTAQEQQAIRDSLVEKYGEGIAPAVYNAISVETASRVRQEYGNVDSIQAARNQAVSEIKDESLRRAVSDGYDSAAYSLAASQGGEGGMNTMSRYIQQRNNTGTGEMSMNATVTAQDGSTKTISITGMSEDGKRVSLADGSEVAVKDLQADADTTSAIQQLADLDLGADATKVLQAYQQSGVAGTEGYRWLMDYATAYNQGRTRQISLEQAAQRSSLDERTVMDAYTLGQQAANRETLAGLEKLKNLPKRKGASGRTSNIDTTEINGKTMSKSELEQFELANQYAQALGVDMKWFSSKEQDGKFIGKNGAYENGKIYMDIHAGRNFAADLTSGILATMGHELSHFEQQYAPEEYQALKEFLFEQIVKSSPNGEARLERLIWEKQRRSGNTLSRKAAEDEVVADACQKMLRDSKAVHDFASQQPEAANGVIRWLDKWFKKVRSIFGRGGNYSEEAQIMDSLEQDVKAAFGELWDKALKQAVQVHDEVGNIGASTIRGIEETGASEQMAEEAVVQNSDRLDDETLRFLDNQEHVTVYRAMQMIDGKLYPPMAAKVEGKLVDATELGEWYQAVERPDLIDPKTGKWKLDKANGKAIKAAYNPYFHTSATPLNDQFSSAYKRPNIVVVEGIIPKSELTSGYKAQYAKDPVGETKWHAGPVASKLKGAKSRRVFLSRWFQAQRVVSDAEVADVVAKTLEGENIAVPNNVVTPSLLEALRERGVAIDEDAINRFESKHGMRQNSDRDTEYLELAKYPEKNAARLQEMVDEAAKLAGYDMELYHGSKKGGGFTVFKDWQYFTANKAYAKRYMERDNPDSLYHVYVKSERMFDTRRPECREIFEQMRSEYGLSELQENGLPDWTDGYDIIDFIEENDLYFDGVVLDEGGDLTESGPVSRGLSYIIRNSNQIKSADPVTYDDSGNVIPLSERFNTQNEDIRYSERDYFDGMSEEQVQEELAKLQQEKATAREKQRSLEKTDEYKRLFQDVLDKRSPEAISAFNKWADESGYVAAVDRAKEVDARRSEGAKVLDRLIDQRLEREEREAIQKSGKSEAEYFAAQAVKNFGYTPYFYDAGYIVPNGKMLNFSGQKGRHFGSRGQDHRAIGQIYAATKGSAAMNRFMNQGNVRIMAESPGIDISNATPLTKEQYATIRRFVNEVRSDEYFNLDFSDERGNNIGSIEYEGRFTADRVLNDIRHFFETGEVRQPSGLSAFYSERDTEYLELAKDPEKNAARLQEMVDEAAMAWGAKTEDGKPKAFYHSTNADFTVFHKGHGMLGEGIYFSTFGQNFYGKNRIKAYLKYDNAIDFRDVPLEGREKTSSGIPMGIIDDFYVRFPEYDAITSRGEEITVKSAKQIKSADPVTYDDSGNVIPLSERFNEANEDIRFSERDYSTPSDEELLMNARVEDADNADQGRLLKDYQALGKRIATLEKQLAEAKRQTQLTNRALNTRGIGNVVKTVMKDYDITDARHNGTAKNATLALTDGYQKALDLLDKGASPADVNDAVYNGAVKAAEIILEQGTYSQNLGGKWQVYSASRYLGDNSQELIDSFVSEAYADFVSNRYREARPETAADRLVARTKKEAQERVDKYKGRSDALAEANRRLEEKTTQAETEAKEARKAAGELFLEIKDLRQELLDNKTMSEQERKAASKKLKSLNKSLEAKREEAASWQKRAKRNASLLKSALESKSRDISALNNRLSKEQAAALEKQKNLEAKLEKQIQRERDILAGKLRSPELVKLLKAEREKAEARVKEQKEAQFARYKEGKKAGELRRRIVRHSKELYGKLTKPSDKRHIPDAYRGAVAALLNTINLESAYDIQDGTKNETGRGGKHVEKGTGTATNRTKAFQEVRKQLEKVLAEGGFTGELINNAADGFDGGLIEKCQDFADKPISTLSSEELETLWNTIRALEHNIATFNKAFALAKNETISGLADSFLASAQKRKPLLKDPKSRLDLKIKKTSGAAMKALENPYTFFSHYGEEGIKLYRALRDTQDLEIVRTNNLSDLWVRKMADILGDEKTAKLNGDELTNAILDKIRDTSKQMDEKVETFKLENGQTITLTHAMLMDVYLLAQRGEVGMNHLLGSGLIQPEIRAKGKYVARDPSFRKLSLQDVQKLTGVITENATEKAIADAIQSMQHQLADWGNKASMDVFGYRKFTEDNYWPVKNAKEENKSDSGKGGNQPANVMNKGMAKNLVPNAATGMEPMSAFTKLQGSISDMLMYATWGPVMEDFKRFYNWKWLNPNGGTSDTVKGVMERYGGEGSQRYWEELRDQINNGIGNGKNIVDQFIGKAVGAVKGARVAYNLRVVVQQPTAYARAAEVISGKYLAASLLDIKSWGWKAKSAWNRALTHSPIAMRKDSTIYDMGGNISVGGEFGLDRPGRLDKAREFGTALAGKADAITWGRLWHAAELQVSAKTNLEHGSQEYWDAVNKLFTEAVDRTQVVDGLLQRPAIMRTDSDFVKGATSYMGEPLMQLNMLMRQVNDFRQTGFKATKKQIGKTVTALVVTQLFNAMLTGLYDAGIRKDDEDKDFWERFVAEITGLDGTEENAWDYITSIWLESNTTSEMSVMQKIPLLKDVLSMLQGYDPSNNRMDLEAVKDLIDVCTKVLWNDKYTPLHKAKEIINKSSMIFGAGFGNALKDMYGVTRNIVNDFGKPKARFDFKALWLNPASKKNKSQYFDLLFQMLENGDKDAFRQRAKELAGQDGMLQFVAKAAIERYLADGLSPEDVWDMMEAARDGGMSDEKFYDYAHGRMADAIKKSYLNRKLEDDQAITLLMQYAGKDEKDAWNSVRKWKDQTKHVGADGKLPDDYKWNQYDDLDEAVANGEDVTGLLTEYRNRGYTETQINGALRDSIQEAMASGDLNEDEAADALIRYGVTYSKDGKTVVYDKQSAWKKVQEWADKAEHTDEEGEPEDGYKYSVYSDLFDAVDANQDAEKVIKEMVQNGGYDADSLREQIKEHLRERFITGEITETALKNQLSRYCKITKSEDANEIVANAKCKRDFGVYPDDLKEAFKDGNLSQNQAVKALQQYNGLSKTDAQNRVRYWGYDGDLSENAWLKWNKDLKGSGLSVENWEKVSKVKNNAKGTDANGDGKADYGTAKAEVVSYIDSMNIPKSQKKAIYLAFGWAASTMPNWR